MGDTLMPREYLNNLSFCGKKRAHAIFLPDLSSINSTTSSILLLTLPHAISSSNLLSRVSPNHSVSMLHKVLQNLEKLL